MYLIQNLNNSFESMPFMLNASKHFIISFLSQTHDLKNFFLLNEDFSARICGPIFVSFIYVNYGTYWTFGLCTATLGKSNISVPCIPVPSP